MGNPGVAAVLSFVFNGLGQLYNGQIFKGLVIVFLSFISMLILILGAVFMGFWFWEKIFFNSQLIVGASLFIAGILFICIIAIYSITDAHKTALKK